MGKFKPVKRVISGLLAVSTLLTFMPLDAYAEELAPAENIYLEENQIDSDILESDVFYIASAMGTFEESNKNHYLLRISRGGECKGASSVNMKIADLSAKYGKDYTVSLLGGGEETENPETNESLVEMIRGEDYEATPLISNEEFSEMAEEDETIKQNTAAAVNEAISFIESEAGLTPAEPADGSETAYIDPLQQARAAFTGVDGEPQRVTASEDTYAQIQKVADVVTGAVVGANLKIDFAEGEDTRYVVIDIIDNDEHDGDRYFYLMLSKPEGTTTISAASSFAGTISDDEETKYSDVSFGEVTVDTENNVVRAEIRREGGINSICDVQLTSEGISAHIGRDFSPVDMAVIFPPGMESRTIDIPVCTDYIDDKADFLLKLTATANAEVKTPETTVTLEKTEYSYTGVTQDVEYLAQPESVRSLNTVITDNPINLQNPFYTYNCRDFSGNNRWTGSCYQMEPVQGGFLNFMASLFTGVGNPTCAASWTAGRPYIHSGVQLDWDRSGNCADIVVSWGNEPSYYDTNMYRSKGHFGRSIKNFYYYHADSECIRIQSDGNCRKCNWLNIYSASPIKRMFQIDLKSPFEDDRLKFLNEDGTYSYYENSELVELSGAVNTTGNRIYLVYDEAFTLNQGTAAGEGYYTYVKALKGWNGETIEDYTDTSATAVSKKLTESYIQENSDQNKNGINADNTTKLFRYYQNDVYMNDTRTKGFYGQLDVHPQFGYKDAVVKVIMPEENYGYLKFSGTDIKVDAGSTQEFTYHRGDIIKVEMKKFDEKDGLIRPVGFAVHAKYNNENEKGWVTDTPVMVYYANDADCYLDLNKRLQYGYYEITPVYGSRDTQIKVRVKNTDMELFDQSYGIFNVPKRKEIMLNGEKYTEYTIYDDTRLGEVYSVTARLKSGNDTKGIIWRTSEEADIDKDYTGEVFYFNSGINSKNNKDITITLSCKDCGRVIPYHDLSGSVSRYVYNIASKQTGQNAAISVEGAAVSCGGSSTITDENGNFRLSPFKGAPDKYVRYVIYVNGACLLREAMLTVTTMEKKQEEDNNAGKSKIALFFQKLFSSKKVYYYEPKIDEGVDRQVTYYNENGEAYEETLRTVSHDVGMQMINTENGGFIENVSIANENNQNGSFSIEVRSLDTVKMSVSSSGTQKYIKTVADKSVSGKPTEVEADEKLIGAEFIAVDPVTYKEGKSFKAELNADTNNYEAEIPLSEVSPGDLLFVNIITDRANTEYAQFNDDGEYVTTKDDADMNRTVYSYINTGYTFVQSPNEPLVLPKQQLNPLSDITFMELPLLGSVGFSFDFPFVSVSVNRTDVGYRLSIGVGAMQIADKVKEKHMTSYSGTKDTYYKDLFSLDDPLGSFANSVSMLHDEIMDMRNYAKSDGREVAANAMAAAGSPTWKADVQVGVYFDFALPQYTELIIDNKHNDFYFTGVGGYIGVSGGFRLTMYTILPLVYMPAYFGIDLELSGLGYFGAKADMSKPTITYYNAIEGSVDFDSHIDKYSNELKLSGRVQIYVGVGLNGVLGLRGGGTFNAIGQYEPSELVSDWGAMLEVKAGIWIDMFLFSLPIQISLAKTKFGSFKDYENESISTKPEEQNRSNGFALRKAYTSKDPSWLPNGSEPAVKAVSGNTALMENDIEYRSAFSESTSYTLVSDGYEHADVKLLKLSDGSIFMAFLDTAPGRDALERTILKYSVFKNGNWSDPVAVKDDGTADFQPSICEMDNSRVMISWLSSDPSVDKTGEAADYLSSLEVYTAVIDKDAVNPVSELTRLTNDEYYDYMPISVYDDVTGDRAVYYVKTASDGTAEEMVNSYTNDCVIVYMLCSDPEGDGNKRWLTDYYYDEEAASEEDKQELIENWNGQRFLSSPIPELGIDVPNISDLTATSYNGLAVFAYTIDQDSSNDTTYDKEMFVQFYDFETHKTYVPVRLSNDNLSDAIPQLIRTKYKDKECTMLFWYRNERDVVYVNISELVKEGLNDDGTIKPEFYQDENDSAEYYDDSIERIYHYVQTPSDSSQGYRSMADFKAVVDKDNAYIVWSQYADNTPETEDGAENQKNLSREIFAAALISDDKDPDASEGTDSDKKQIPCAWSNPYRLTYSGACTDEPAVAVDNSGNMMVVYNQYNQTVTDDPDNPLIISDFKLRASYMEPCGAVDAESIEVSNLTPVNGEKVKVDVNIVNNGLTYAEGYTVDLYVQDDKGNRELLSNFDSDEILGAGGKAVCSAEWTAGNSVKDTVFAAEVYEKGGSWTNKSYLESPKLLQRAEYEVSDVSVKQQDNDFILSYNVKNTGNAASDSNDGYKLILTGPYCDTSDYTYEECIFANEPAGGINAGDEKRFNVKLTMPEGVFDKYGFIDCMGIMEDKNNNYRSSGDQVRIIPEKPINLKLNGKILPQTIEINVGDSIDLDISCSPANFNKNLSAEFSVDDTSVAAVIDGRLEALQEGTTYLRGTTGINGTVIPETKIVVVDKRRMIGDVSGNRSIDLYDAVMVAKHMVGNIKLSDEEKEAADVNRNTKIDLYDAIEIAKYLVKKH